MTLGALIAFFIALLPVIGEILTMIQAHQKATNETAKRLAAAERVDEHAARARVDAAIADQLHPHSP